MNADLWDTCTRDGEEVRQSGERHGDTPTPTCRVVVVNGVVAMLFCFGLFLFFLFGVHALVFRADAAAPQDYVIMSRKWTQQQEEEEEEEEILFVWKTSLCGPSRETVAVRVHGGIYGI